MMDLFLCSMLNTLDDSIVVPTVGGNLKELDEWT